MTQDTTTSSNVNQLFVAIGTAALFPLNLENDYASIHPTTNMLFEELDHQPRELVEDETLVSIEQIQILRKIETLKSFSNSLIKNSQSLDKEIIEIVNKEFWDWF